MSVILLALGILVTGAGLAAVGFGIPINDLGIGQTLIVAGATAFSAGLLLIGLAAAVAQLAQVAEALRARPARPGIRAAEGPLRAEIPLPVTEVQQPRTEPPLQRSAPPVPQAEPQLQVVEPPQLPASLPRPAEVRPIEPKPPVEPGVDVSASAIERLRSSLPRPDRVVPEPDVAPGAVNGATHPPVAAAPEVKPPEPAKAETARGPRLDFLFRSRQARNGKAESFETVWPTRPGGRQADAAEQVQAVVAAPELQQPDTPTQAEPAAAPEARSVAILKSGVVDGMAYTLYTDGSIEAQLPQGTVRFGSIVELRAHIENNS